MTEIDAKRWLLRSKIHKATVTAADPDYVGSVTIDLDLMERVGIWPGERVMVVSNATGARLETYAISGVRGSGEICMNGGAAHMIKPGEEIIIMGFALASEPIEPRIILVDAENRYVRDL